MYGSLGLVPIFQHPGVDCLAAHLGGRLRATQLAKQCVPVKFCYSSNQRALIRRVQLLVLLMQMRKIYLRKRSFQHKKILNQRR